MSEVRHDSAPEFIEMRKNLYEKEIGFTTSTAYKPLSSGLAERIIQIVMEKPCAMLNDVRLPWRYSEKALTHFAYLHTYTTLRAIKKMASHQSLLVIAPGSSKLRIFGCAAYVHVDKAARKSKLEDLTQLGAYLGTLNELYRRHALQDDRVVHSKHVTVDEHNFLSKLEAEPTLLKGMHKVEMDCVQQTTQCVPFKLR